MISSCLFVVLKPGNQNKDNKSNYISIILSIEVLRLLLCKLNLSSKKNLIFNIYECDCIVKYEDKTKANLARPKLHINGKRRASQAADLENGQTSLTQQARRASATSMLSINLRKFILLSLNGDFE